ncbi:VWA domain-containing protein [Lapillicoccus sp.]|uniref:VWA domain-containing protein n=1 Tax=Lapillicoccus sp. TaxID=1909287 RepID=UPI0025FD6077|nr:VWA domain-containing protein [Lapillicoccus sp.]
MTVQPVVPWLLLVLLAAVAGFLVWWPAGPRERTDSVLTRSRRSAMVALLLVAAVRPGMPGGEITVSASDLDVYFLIDTTSSVMAQDYAGGQPRLAGVRADVKGIAAQLPGARYTVMSFDHQTVTRLPLTSDANALASSVDTLLAETSTWSQGSSVTVARTALSDALDHGRATHPERARLVFYLGDGEQTADTAPDPFDIDPTLVNGGAVLGYGSTQGGRMKQTGTRREDDILDPSTGQPALSKIDEKELRAIAGQLKVPYLHRTSDDGAASIVSEVALKDTASLTSADATQAAVGRTEYYWVFLLALAALAAWDLGVSVAAATALRAGRRRPDDVTPQATGTAAVNPPAVLEKVSAATPGGAV